MISKYIKTKINNFFNQKIEIEKKYLNKYDLWFYNYITFE
jgi:hypothetical protein